MRQARNKEAHAPGLEARGRTRRSCNEEAYVPWAVHREAYALSHLRGGAPAWAQGEVANVSCRKQGGVRALGHVQGGVRQAVYKEAHLSRLKARRQMRQASDKEAYAPGRRPGGQCTKL